MIELKKTLNKVYKFVESFMAIKNIDDILTKSGD